VAQLEVQALSRPPAGNSAINGWTVKVTLAERRDHQPAVGRRADR